MHYSKIIKPLFYSVWLAVTAANAQPARQIGHEASPKTEQPKTSLLRQTQLVSSGAKQGQSAQTGTDQEDQAAKDGGEGGKTSQPLPFFQALKLATEIRIYQSFPEYVTKLLTGPLVVLSEKSHPRMFHLLKHSTPKPGSYNPVGNMTRSNVSLVANGKVIENVNYFPKSGGLIGLIGDEGIAPKEFVLWTLDLEERLSDSASTDTTRPPKDTNQKPPSINTQVSQFRGNTGSTPQALPMQNDHKDRQRSLWQHRIQSVLRNVYRIDVVKFIDTSVWENCLQGNNPRFEPKYAMTRTFTIDTDSDLLLSLRQSTRYHSDAPKVKQHTGFVIFCWAAYELDTGPHAYVYIPQSGELGSGHEWCSIPPYFRKHINEAIERRK